jgi:trigger factor
MLEDSRLTLPQFLEATGKSDEEYSKELEPEAAERVKRDLGLAAIADAEQITVSDQEGAQWYEMMSALTTGQRERWNSLNASQKRSVLSRLRRDKALNRMVEIATEGKWPPAAAEASESAATERNATAAAQATEEPEAKAETEPAKPAKAEAKAETKAAKAEKKADAEATDEAAEAKTSKTKEKE